MVAKLRRPSVAEWALNRVALDTPEPVRALLDAVEAVRGAQAAAMEGRSGADLRSATEARRTAAADVARRAAAVLVENGRNPDPQSGAIGDVLRRVGASTAAGEQLRAGRLGAEPVPLDDDPFGGLTSLADTVPAPRARSRPETPEKADAGARRAREREVSRARETFARARQALDQAEAGVAEAAAGVTEAEADLEQARAAVAKAEGEHKRRTGAQARAEARRDEALAAVAEAQRAIDEAEQE